MNPINAIDAFTTARCRFEQFQDAVGPYTARARNRVATFHARYVYDHVAKDAAAYDEAVAAYTDPADFAQYTESELDEHTAAIEKLTAAFDNFAAAFAALGSATLNSDDEFYVTACASFNLYCETYAFAAKSYSLATLCADLAAVEAKAQARKDGAKTWLNAIASDPDAEPEIAVGETRADLFLAKAKSAVARAEELCERVNKMIGTDGT